MKLSWSTLNLSDILFPTIPAIFKEDQTQLFLSFIHHRLKPENADLLPWDYYKEFFELALLILGGTQNARRDGATPFRNKEQTVTPDGCQKPRYSSTSFLTFLGTRRENWKIWHSSSSSSTLSHGSDPPTCSVLLTTTSSFIVHGILLKFNKYHKKLSQVGLTVLQRHTLYLTEELVPLSLFSCNVSEDVHNSLAQRISFLSLTSLPISQSFLPLLPGHHCAWLRRTTLLSPILPHRHPSFLPCWSSVETQSWIREGQDSAEEPHTCQWL